MSKNRMIKLATTNVLVAAGGGVQAETGATWHDGASYSCVEGTDPVSGSSCRKRRDDRKADNA